MPRRHQFLYLDQSELAKLQHFMRRMAVKHDWRARRRGNAILLSHQKRPIPEIARTLGKTEHSIYNWIRLYRAKGIEGIAPFKPPTKLTDEQVKELLSVSHYSALGKSNKDYHNRWSLRRMAQWVGEKWNIQISYERIRQIVRQKLREI